MAGDDDDDKHGSDPDRAAILARRKHFIAVALSGLATGLGGCTNPNERKLEMDWIDQPKPPEQPPQPCLNVASPRDPETGETGEAIPSEALDETGEAPEVDEPPKLDPKPDPKPRPCLKRAPPKPDPQPQPCLKMLPPESE